MENFYFFSVKQVQFLPNHSGVNIKVKFCYCETNDFNLILEIVIFHISDISREF